MKRREPSGEQRSSEARHGLRAQLSRAVGGSLDVIRSVLSSNPKSVDVSKQRLSDVLWNDRTLLATHESASGRSAVQDERDLPDEAAAAVAVEPDVAERRVTAALEPDSVESPADSAGALLRAEARRSEVMRARLEATKARLATRLTALPDGVAPIAEEPAEPPAPAPPEPPAPAEAAPPSAAGAPRDDPADEDDGEEEPIRTRSMARLLASQGHRKRALKIYDALLAANGGDAELRAEADALRAG